MKIIYLQAILFFLMVSFAFGEDIFNQQKNENTAIYLARLEKTGNEGYPKAFYELGEVYEDGKIVKKDEKTALVWYKKSADAGYDEGLTRVGYFYSIGIGTESDPIKACAYYEKGALLGNHHAAYNMGLAYAKGRGVKKDMDKSNYWFEKAYEFGNLDQKVSVGEYYLLFRKDTPYETRGLKILEDAATNHDHTQAQRFLGTTYYLQPRTLNAEKAFYWLQKAAAKGNTTAIVYLGKMYYHGTNPPGFDLEKARKLFKQAGEFGDAEGFQCLGATFLDKGTGNPEMETKGVENLQKAAEMGDAMAQYMLGMFYIRASYGLPQDYVKAAGLLQKAAEQGDDHAQYELARLYYEGQGVPENGQLMVKWLKASAAQGNAAARELLDDLTQVAKARAALGASVLDTAPAPAATPTPVAVPAATAPAP